MPGDSRSSSVTVGEFRNLPFATFHSQESFRIMSQHVVDEISLSGPKMHYKQFTLSKAYITLTLSDSLGF